MIIGGLVLEVIYYYVGWLDFKKWQIWKIETEWGGKTKEVNPLSVEMIETHKEICKKLGIKHKFTDLHRSNDKKI